MIAEHFQELRSTIEQAEGLPDVTRTRLLQLAEELEREASQINPEQVQADLESSDAGAPEYESENANKLVSAIEGLEASHPELTAAVSNTASMLSRLGF